MYMSSSPATFLIETDSQNTLGNSEPNMAVMASNGPSPHSPSLPLGLPAPQPSRRHHAQSLLAPSFHDPTTHHVLEFDPEQAAPLSRRDDEQRHAVCSHSALALRLRLSCGLQHLLNLSLLNLRPSLLQFVSIASLLLDHRSPILEPVCLCSYFPLLPLLSHRNELQL